MASSACLSLSRADCISTAACSVAPALTALLTADWVTANCSDGGLPAQPARTTLLPTNNAASFRLRRGFDARMLSWIFMLFVSIGELLESPEKPGDRKSTRLNSSHSQIS